jgi:hypothetical protein
MLSTPARQALRPELLTLGAEGHLLNNDVAAATITVTGGEGGARSHYRFALPLIHFIPGSLTYSVPLFLKRQCDRTPGKGAPRGAIYGAYAFLEQARPNTDRFIHRGTEYIRESGITWMGVRT